MSEGRYVVLDLFVVHAITASDETYLRTAALLQRIIDRCHRVILTPSLSREYKARLKQLERGGYANDRLFKIIKMLLLKREKVVEKDDPGFDIPIKIPEDDKVLVKTVGGNTVIVTTNRRHLIENEELRRYIKGQRSSIEILSLEEALSKL